jgi:uncharacterized protein
VDDLVVSPEQVAGAAVERSRDELPGAVVLRMTAGAAAPPSAELYPELPAERPAPDPELPAERPAPGRTVPVTFVPHFLWGNRRPEAMRVWVRNA